MCRWLAYSGSPVLLEELLYGPKNSLIVQSLHSQMGAEETNGDGFGVGWYGAQETPGVFHSMEPAWNDRNLRELSGHINSGLVFAHIRASTGSPVQHTNCHPFRHGRWLWMHNGLITDFHKTKRDLVLAISFRRGLRQTVEGVHLAHARSAYCVGITDTYVSPLARECDEVFLASVESTSFGASYSAPVALVNAILAACGQYRRPQTLAVLKEIAEEQRKGFRWYTV